MTGGAAGTSADMTEVEIPAGLEILLRERIRDVPDFPKPGVVFKDITPLLADPAAFSAAVDAMTPLVTGVGAGTVIGIEARGFILAAPVALRAGAGFLPVRKAGKLPGPTLRTSYALEYGEAVLELPEGAVGRGDRVVVVDDVLATGGTVAAAIELVHQSGAEVGGVAVLLELGFLAGRQRLAAAHPGLEVHALLTT